MSPSIYLKFPDLQPFLEYIRNYCNIYEIGLVIRRQPSKPYNTTYFLRLTKNAPSLQLILSCDVEFFNDILTVDIDEKLTQLRDAKIAEVKAAIEKTLGKNVTIIEAEYQLEP